MKTLVTYTYFIGAIQGCLVFLALWLKKKNFLANRILAVLTLNTSIDLFISFIMINDTGNRFTVLYTVSFPLMFLFGPLLYFYLSALTLRIEKIDKKDLIHTVPFTLSFLPVFSKLFTGNEFHPDIPMIFHLFPDVSQDLHGLIYGIFTLTHLKRYEDNIRKYFSNIEKIDLKWLYSLLFLNIVFWFATLFSDCAIFFGFFFLPLPQFDTFYFAKAILIFIIAYATLNQPGIFKSVSNMRKEHAKKYEKRSLNRNQSSFLKKELFDLMEKQKPYLDPKLTLSSLASSINVEPPILTQLLNTEVGMNFYKFVNKFRVREVKKLIAEDKNLEKNIMEIAFSAGFNSKATFNGVFKRETGTTPSQFRKELFDR